MGWLHYQYREYHFSSVELECARPLMKTKVDLRNIHNSYHTVGLVLSLFINIGLSSRQTREVLGGLFGIGISHQTVINYVNASASVIAPWLDKSMPKPTETCIIVENQWHCTWFTIDSATRAICGYNISGNCGTEPALATLYNIFGYPDQTQTKSSHSSATGLAAINAYNQKSTVSIIQGENRCGTRKQR